MGFRTGHIVNPLERGHIAYRKRILKEKFIQEKGCCFFWLGERRPDGKNFLYDPEVT